MVISYDWGSKEESKGEGVHGKWVGKRGGLNPPPRLETVTLRPNFLVNFYKMPCSFSLLSLKLSVFIYHQFQKLGQQQQTKNLSKIFLITKTTPNKICGNSLEADYF